MLTFIATPTREWAQGIAHERGLTLREWRYVSAPFDVYGHRPPFDVIVRAGEGRPLSAAQVEALAYLRAVNPPT